MKKGDEGELEPKNRPIKPSGKREDSRKKRFEQGARTDIKRRQLQDLGEKKPNDKHNQNTRPTLLGGKKITDREKNNFTNRRKGVRRRPIHLWGCAGQTQTRKKIGASGGRERRAIGEKTRSKNRPLTTDVRFSGGNRDMPLLRLPIKGGK